jgi:methylenetetrahydrofolate reductase (NADPH)
MQNRRGSEKVGTEWLIHAKPELKKAGVPVLHYYTLGKPKVIEK